MVDKRLQREKLYHNMAFKDGIRKSADKYYAIHKVSFDELMRKMLFFCKGKKILEYGCGEGSHSLVLAKKANEVVSIDISDFAVATAKNKAIQNGVNNIHFHEMNAEKLDFPDESFDMVYGNAIIHHLDLAKAFSEVKRVLKSGGKAFFYEPLGHNVFINAYRKRTPHMRTIDEHPLLMKDIELAQQFFSTVNVTYFHLTTLFTIPLRNLKYYNTILSFFYKVDSLIFKILPFLKKNAWYCIIEITKD